MSRKEAREKAFQVLFGQNFSDIENKNRLYSLRVVSINDDLDSEDKEFVETLYSGVLMHLSESIQTLNKVLKGYSFNELYQVDKTILLIALFELNYTGTDKKIVINEAVEIAKKYGTEKSPKFVNGVLSGVLKINGWEYD